MEIGARLGRYRIERLLGRGGMGAVYLATDTEAAEGDDEQVVVKVMNHAAAGDPIGVARLEREARAAARVDSPRVVRVIESDVIDRTPFIAMEYVEGTTVQAILAEKKRVPHE